MTTNRVVTAPTAHIQYKGTHICMDIRCECGEHTHFDGDFAYSIECGKCGMKYDMPSIVALEPYSDFHDVKITDVDPEPGPPRATAWPPPIKVDPAAFGVGNPSDPCPVCGAVGIDSCSTISGRDHKKRWNR